MAAFIWSASWPGKMRGEVSFSLMVTRMLT